MGGGGDLNIYPLIRFCKTKTAIKFQITARSITLYIHILVYTYIYIERETRYDYYSLMTGSLSLDWIENDL